MLSVMLLALVAAPAPDLSIDEIQLWLTYYYLKPRPELTLPSLAIMERELQRTKGRSLADEVERGGMRTFYAKVFERNPSVVEEAAQKLSSMSPSQQAFTREALRRCGTPECAQALGSNALNPTAASGPDPGTLDDSWAAFFATGEAKYVQEIIEVLPWSETHGDTNRLLAGGAAKWSLASNAYQHRRVLEICGRTAATASDPTKRLLREIVAQAEKERAKNPPPEPK
jgi:hypothetical protein